MLEGLQHRETLFEAKVLAAKTSDAREQLAYARGTVENPADEVVSQLILRRSVGSGHASGGR